MNTITMFGADWCPDCRRAKAYLNDNGIDYEFKDIDLDGDAVALVEQINGGKRVIPTFEIGGVAYTNPDNRTLADVLGINPQGRVILYGADWCPDCRRAKSFLDSQGIRYQFISTEEHAWAAEAVEKINGGKRIIPTLLIDDVPYTNPDNKTLTELLKLGQEETAELYDAIVIGAGAAGLTTALYLQREKFSTLILEKKNIGGNTFLTQKIENYPGFATISGPELMERMGEQAKGVGVEIKEGFEVTGIRKDGLMFIVETPMGEYRSRALVSAVGSTYRTIGVPGETEFIGAGVHFCATCDGPFYKDKEVVVIGGGNSAVEEALYLSEMCSHVHVVHRREEFSATPEAAAKLLEREKVTVHMNMSTIEFTANDKGRFGGVALRDNASGEERTLNAEGAFIFIGLIPNTQFLRDVVDLDERGFILSECGSVQTSMPGFFAAGDARKGAIAQVASATGEGVVASFAVKEYLRSGGGGAR